jgi:hypothetical protein
MLDDLDLGGEFFVLLVRAGEAFVRRFQPVLWARRCRKRGSPVPRDPPAGAEAVLRAPCFSGANTPVTVVAPPPCRPASPTG